jgi:hypothetical protein
MPVPSQNLTIQTEPTGNNSGYTELNYDLRSTVYNNLNFVYTDIDLTGEPFLSVSESIIVSNTYTLDLKVGDIVEVALSGNSEYVGKYRVTRVNVAGSEYVINAPFDDTATGTLTKVNDNIKVKTMLVVKDTYVVRYTVNKARIYKSTDSELLWVQLPSSDFKIGDIIRLKDLFITGIDNPGDTFVNDGIYDVLSVDGDWIAIMYWKSLGNQKAFAFQEYDVTGGTVDSISQFSTNYYKPTIESNDLKFFFDESEIANKYTTLDFHNYSGSGVEFQSEADPNTKAVLEVSHRLIHTDENGFTRGYDFVHSTDLVVFDMAFNNESSQNVDDYICSTGGVNNVLNTINNKRYALNTIAEYVFFSDESTVKLSVTVNGTETIYGAYTMNGIRGSFAYQLTEAGTTVIKLLESTGNGQIGEAITYNVVSQIMCNSFQLKYYNKISGWDRIQGVTYIEDTNATFNNFVDSDNIKQTFFVKNRNSVEFTVYGSDREIARKLQDAIESQRIYLVDDDNNYIIANGKGNVRVYNKDYETLSVNLEIQENNINQ